MRAPSLLPLFFLLLALSITPLRAQGLYVPVGDPGYEYLARLQARGLTEYSKLVLPLTRSEIARHLAAAEASLPLMTRVEREELNWFREEYAFEYARAGLAPEGTPRPRDRWRLFSWTDSTFRFFLSPILGLEAARRREEMEYHRWNGLSVAASYGDRWGARMEFRDNWEKGSRLDLSRAYSSEPGYSLLVEGKNTIEYDEVQGSLTYETREFALSAGKERFTWGSGYRSQLILSAKAPSFPAIRLDFAPVRWLRFHYIHGWLNSRVPDSAASYSIIYHPTDTSMVIRYRQVDQPKFYAAHILELIPHRDIRIAIGESVVYSDAGPSLGFLIPVLFFRSVDHYEEGGSGSRGSNSQFFLDLHGRFLERFTAYATLFIDEFSLTDFLNGNNDRNQFGYTVGGSAYALLPDLMLRAEYTRILPWVYSNKFPAQWYTNSGYLLGHIIGQNADQIFLQADHRPLRGLVLQLRAEIIRRGGFDDVSFQNAPGSRPFLYGPRRTDKTLGFAASYEFLHECFARAWYDAVSVSDEDPNRTPPSELGKRNDFGCSLSYGF